MEKAYFAGGCFWCIEAGFVARDGVNEALSGYMRLGDAVEKTEVVEVHYDPSVLQYAELLKIFWVNIDPDDDAGQFHDRGQKYRTAIIYQNDEERDLAIQSKKDKEAELDRPLAPLIVESTTFIVAEDGHQNYHEKHPDHYKQYKIGSGRAAQIVKNLERKN